MRNQARERPACLNHELLLKLKVKNELYKQLKKGVVVWEEYRDTSWLCRVEVRKARVGTDGAELHKDNKKGFYRPVK